MMCEEANTHIITLITLTNKKDAYCKKKPDNYQCSPVPRTICSTKLWDQPVSYTHLDVYKRQAILKAIEQPRDIDINLVNAQQARRILDRIVGFELSPVLWKKVKPALSAGRVQSVAVRLIVEREREIQAFKSEASYRVTAVFLVPDADGKLVEMKAELARRLKTKKEAQKFLESGKAATFSIEDIVTRDVYKRQLL